MVALAEKDTLASHIFEVINQVNQHRIRTNSSYPDEIYRLVDLRKQVLSTDIYHINYSMYDQIINECNALKARALEKIESQSEVK